jgi:ORF6N domain
MKNFAPPDIDSLITTVRGQKVILDAELASIYEVPTKALNQAVKRNQDKFPEDFLFQLTSGEVQEARWPIPASAVSEATADRSQIVTGSQKHRDPRHRPYAFTEHGAIMAANVLNSPRATQMSVFVVRAFVKMREHVAANAAILKRLAEIDKTLLIHDTALREVFQKLRPLLEPPPAPPKPEIGFHVKEDAVPYRVKRKA